MSIKLEVKDYFDENYDICGNTTKGVLIVNGIRIPLCRNCLEELKEEVNEFDKFDE